MAQGRPIGIWVIAFTTVVGAVVLLVPELLGATWTAHHYGMSLFEAGFWNLLSLFALAITSAIGVVLGRAHARLALLFAIITPAVTFVFGIKPLVVMVRDAEPERLDSPLFWVRLWMLPTLLTAIAAGFAVYLFLSTRCRIFYEKTGA